MTTQAPAIPRTPLARLRWALADAGTITGRDLAHWARQPGQVIVGLLFPILLLLMFNYLWGGSMRVPGGGDYSEFLVPGLLGLTVYFGIEATAISVNADAAKGVTERFRSMPMARSAVVAGRSVADMLNATLGLAVMVAAGLLVGWQWHEGAGKALLAIALLLLLRFAVIRVGIYLGLIIKSPEGVAAVQILIWPFGLLSNAFVAPSTMPDWLGVVAEWNPLSSTVAAIRELFGNPGWGGDSWIAQHAIEMAIVWPLVITAIFGALSVRAYQRLGD
jgi:ABC-2 type transport system permease protein